VSVAPSRSCSASRGVARRAGDCGLTPSSAFDGDSGECEWDARRMVLLTDDQITAELSESPGWALENGEITRTIERRDFKDALLLVGAVAFLAEQANHHPDILIKWNKVTLTLSTHPAGGLTAADFALAARVSALDG